MTSILLVRGASDNFGGIERQVLYIARGIAENGGFEPVLVTSNGKTRFAKAYAELGLPVEIAPSLLVSALKASTELDRIAVKHAARAIQSHMFRESIAARLVRLRRRGLVHLARVHTYIDCSWIPKWRKACYHAIERLTSQGVDHFLPISHLAQRELSARSFIPQHKITVVPDGVPQLGAPDAANTNCTPLPPKIAMVSNFLEHKGHDVLIRGLAELKRRGLMVCARLIGGRPVNEHGTADYFEMRLRDQAYRAGVLDQLEFHGFTSDVYSAIRDFPVVVLPSDSEGLPNCILEAMSVRKLVVCSHVGAVPEIIAHGQNGLLHAVQDDCEFASLLARIFTAPAYLWESMRNEALETWRSRFSLEAMIQRLTQVYEGMGIRGASR